MTNCGAGEVRGFGNPIPNIGIQNPTAPDASNSLQIITSTQVDDQGVKSHSISLKMKDLTPQSQLKWSLTTLLGPRFKVRISDTLISMTLQTEGVDAGFYIPDSPFPSLSSSQFDQLHSKPLAARTIQILNQDNMVLSQPKDAPLGLADYATTTFPPLANRTLSNCAANTSLPDTVEWSGSSSRLMRFFFYNENLELRSSFTDVADVAEWLLPLAVFQSYFSTAELSQLETPDPLFGYGSDVKLGYMSFARSVLHSVALPTNPPQLMSIYFETAESAKYRMEYQGGCGL